MVVLVGVLVLELDVSLLCLNDVCEQAQRLRKEILRGIRLLEAEQSKEELPLT